MANFILGAFNKYATTANHVTQEHLTVRLMRLHQSYYIKLSWIIILTPHDLQPTFEHVGSCVIPVCCDTTSLALLLSQVNQQDHLKS